MSCAATGQISMLSYATGPNQPPQIDQTSPITEGWLLFKKEKSSVYSAYIYGHGVYCVHTAIHINSGIYRFVTHVLMEYIHIFIIFDM